MQNAQHINTMTGIICTEHDEVPSTPPLPRHMQGKETGLNIIAYSNTGRSGTLKQRVYG
jgi:hypothetical protein